MPPEINFDPTTINNVFSLLALVSILLAILVLFYLRNKNIKEDKPVKSKISAEDVTSESFQILLTDIMQRCKSLEEKVKKNNEDIEAWFDKYRQLDEKHNKMQFDCEMDRLNLTNIITEQDEKIQAQETQINILTDKVNELEKLNLL